LNGPRRWNLIAWPPWRTWTKKNSEQWGGKMTMTWLESCVMLDIGGRNKSWSWSKLCASLSKYHVFTQDFELWSNGEEPIH
jgi:hypothetical protein